jgi:glycopeptide antibiotics resistance protein
LALFVLWPRTIDELPAAAPASGTITNAAAKAAHDVLYINGYRELLGNFVMLIPIALLLRKIFPTIKAQSILLICLSTTISIEFLQIYIPGRFSDVRDIATNSLGAVVAVGLLYGVTRYRS